MAKYLDQLEQALANVLNRGEISEEVAHAIRTEFVSLDEESNFKKHVLPEISGYLGGAFVVTAIALIARNQWELLTTFTKSIIFGVLALALFAAGLVIGDSTPPRRRLAGLLCSFAGISTTGSLAVFLLNDNYSLPPFLAGLAVTAIGYLRIRSLVGHLVMFLFFCMTSVMFFQGYIESGYSKDLLQTIFFALLGLIWLYLSYLGKLEQFLGFTLGMGILFFSTQLAFGENYRPLSYLLSAIMVAVVSLLYMRLPSWPLLIGAVVATTFGIGEFVAGTLGGSIGAAIGLLAAGV
ncbi:MAG: hypothetical protein AABY37_03545, partial [Actinomycetota bacterium]